jgi:hypothetical protein
MAIKGANSSNLLINGVNINIYSIENDESMIYVGGNFEFKDAIFNYKSIYGEKYNFNCENEDVIPKELFNLELNTGNIIQAEDSIYIQSGIFNMKAGKGFSFETPANVNIKSSTVNVSNNISVDSLRVNTGYIGNFESPTAQINGTFSGTLKGTAYYATSAGILPIDQPEPNIKTGVVDKTIVTKLNDVKLKIGEGTDKKLVSRLPTHEPWAEHDRNDRIPNLIVKQFKKHEERNDPRPQINANIIRT